MMNMIQNGLLYLGKVLLTFVLIFALILSLGRLLYNDRLDEITDFVLTNEAALVDIAETHLSPLSMLNPTGEYQDVHVDGLITGEHDIVQFYYDGSGIAPSGAYYGFYYSPDDVPVPHDNIQVPLTPAGDHAWEWASHGDNGGRIIRITDKWYYYTAWY